MSSWNLPEQGPHPLIPSPGRRGERRFGNNYSIKSEMIRYEEIL